MKCPKCGTENKGGVKFCKGCGTSLQNIPDSKNSVSESKSNNNNTLIICVTALLCVIVIAGAFILLNNDSNDSSSSDDSVEDTNDVDSVDNNDDSSSSESGISFSEAESYFPEASQTVLSHVFDEADSDEDGVLSDSELDLFKKVRDHTKKYENNVRNEYSTVKPSSDEASGYCADHGRVAVVNGNECPYCIKLGYSDTRTKTSSW